MSPAVHAALCRRAGKHGTALRSRPPPRAPAVVGDEAVVAAQVAQPQAAQVQPQLRRQARPGAGAERRAVAPVAAAQLVGAVPQQHHARRGAAALACARLRGLLLLLLLRRACPCCRRRCRRRRGLAGPGQHGALAAGRQP